MAYPTEPRKHTPMMKPESEVRRRRSSADSGLQINASQLFTDEPLSGSDKHLDQTLREVGKILDSPGEEPKRQRRDLSLARELFPEEPKKAEQKLRAKIEADMERDAEQRRNQSNKETEALLARLEQIEAKFYSIKYDPNVE